MCPGSFFLFFSAGQHKPADKKPSDIYTNKYPDIFTNKYHEQLPSCCSTNGLCLGNCKYRGSTNEVISYSALLMLYLFPEFQNPRGSSASSPLSGVLTTNIFIGNQQLLHSLIISLESIPTKRGRKALRCVRTLYTAVVYV